MGLCFNSKPVLQILLHMYCGCEQLTVCEFTNTISKLDVHKFDHKNMLITMSKITNLDRVENILRYHFQKE